MSKFLDENGLSYFWSKIKASLKTVAFTGSYNDLTNKPNIPQGATVDTALNSSSTNPVQNKAIHSALATKVTSAQAIQAVSGAGYATSANASAIASSLISAGGYVTSTYVAGATVTSAGTATNATNVAGTAGTSTLSWNTDVTLATIGGNAIKAKLPANPNTNTTYTFDTGDANGQIKVTPSGSTAQNVSVKGLGTAAYTSTGAFAAATHTHSYLPLTGGTITGALNIYTDSAYAVGTATGLLNVKYKNAAGTEDYATDVITVIGTDGTDGYNVPISIGSNNGTTQVGAGESRRGFLGARNLYNNENLYLTADGSVNIFTNCANDNATYAGPVTFTGTASNSGGKINVTGLGTVTATTFSGTATSATSATSATNATNVTGTVAIANGGTGQTTRLAAIKALTNENVSTNATHFLGLKSDWSKVGYVSVADAKTVLGLGTAAYTASTAYAAASHTHSYLPLDGGTLTGSLTISRGNPYLYFVETDWSKGTPQSSGTSYQGIYFSGSNAEGGHVTFHYAQDKTSYLQLVCQNLTSAGANANTAVFIATASDGTKHVRPGSNNDTDLGLNGYKWKTVYATTFSGALAGNATTATTAASCTGNAATATNASSLGGKAASQYLTAHQSLANYVTLNGTQTITGTKSFSDAIYLTPNWHNSVCLRTQSYTYKASSPATPSTSIWNGVWLQDKSGNTIGYVQVQFSSAGNTFCELNANSPKSGGSNLYIRLYHNNAGTLKTFRPETTNLITLGHGDNRWKQYFGSSSDSISSDERIKQQITSIPDEILDAWEDIQWYQYKMNDSVAEKGTEKARFHTGLITQRIQTIFQQHNLDASKYGFWCYDSWEAEPAEYNDKGEIITKAKKAGDEYSLRYEEALCLEAAYQRRRADRAEARITALEQRLNELEKVLATLGDHSNAS